MKHYIYKITNLINNKIYIGKHSTDDPNDSYMGSSCILKHAFNKYGSDNFKKEMLFSFDNEDESLLMEADIVDESFVARLDTYNVQLGGRGSWSHINDSGDASVYKSMGNDVFRNLLKTDVEFAAEHSRKTSNGLKLYYSLNDHPSKGRKLSDETKAKLSKAMKGKFAGDKNPSKRADVRKKKSEKFTGRKSITKDGRNKYAYPDEISDYLNDGWKLGRVGY